MGGGVEETKIDHKKDRRNWYENETDKISKCWNVDDKFLKVLNFEFLYMKLYTAIYYIGLLQLIFTTSHP